MTTPLSVTLRITVGLGIHGSIMYAGFNQRSPWLIATFGVVFTVLYIQGKWPVWRGIWTRGGALE